MSHLTKRDISFSMSKLTSIKPEAKSAEFYDRKQPQLKFVVYPTGKRSWLLRYTFEGGKYSIGLGAFPEVDLTNAKKQASELLEQIAGGINPKSVNDTTINKIEASTPEPEDDNILTLAKYAVHYLALAKTRKKSWKEDEAKLRDWILPDIGHLALTAITQQHALALRQKMLMQDRTNATVNRVTSCISSILSIAVTEGLLNNNPLMGFRKLSERMVEEGTMTSEEISRFFKATKHDPNPIASDALSLLLMTGLRSGEVTSARWENFDADNRLLFLPKTKSGKARTVVLSDEACRLIQSQLPVSEFIFHGKDRRKPIVNLKKPLARILAIAGITKHIRIHDLRHSFATYAVNNGIPLEQVKEMLGHSTIQMTLRYAKVGHETLRNSLNSLSMAA